MILKIIWLIGGMCLQVRSLFFFWISKKSFIKKRKTLLSTHEVYTGTTKTSPQKDIQTKPQGPKPLNSKPITNTQINKKTQTNPQGPTLKPETHKEHSMLQHLSLSFTTLRGHARITIVNEAFQIQHLFPPFNLKTLTLINPMEILFNGIQQRE
jgi:hypothetical protein